VLAALGRDAGLVGRLVVLGRRHELIELFPAAAAN
jgi:hypothetical protein